jgi:hypothetical protein
VGNHPNNALECAHMQVFEYRSVTVERDMDLIRDILLKVAADPELDGSRYKVFDTTDFEGHSENEIAYHVDLLFEADYVKGIATLDAPVPAISRLTWAGHEFVDNIRDPGIWTNVKERIKGLPSIAITLVAQLALAEMKKRLDLG